ncbi:F-box protein SKIP23-like [Vicia villosa]|uniref:F-box protein SKIP23-like n=1 Tax=Vicia villosa TaxID=3911 RepID=UPI00273C3948|nr:F-box protein SKIP23-like [Vicia villosa]
MAVDWGNLEVISLNLIFDKLSERIDQIYFSAVCKYWYYIAKVNHQHRKTKNNALPMLMIPQKNKCRTKRSLYGLSSNTIYPLQLQVPYNRRLCGSSHGWLAKVESSKNIVITLLNPFQNLAPIPLPPIYMLNIDRRRENYECNVHKVILSTNPTTRPHDYITVAIYSMRKCLAFIKAGQKLWTYIDCEHFCFTDVIFYKGLVYAVGRWNNIISLDLCCPGNANVIPNVVSSRGDVYAHRAYLVESLEGDLWLIRKFISYPPHDFVDENRNNHSNGTKRFEVYKLELDLQSGKLKQMVKLDSLGDNVVFVGDSDSVSFSASYFSNHLQKDSIYYSDDFYDDMPFPYPNGAFNMGIYNVKDGSFSQHCPFHHWFKRMPPAIWVLPPNKWD